MSAPLYTGAITAVPRHYPPISPASFGPSTPRNDGHRLRDAGHDPCATLAHNRATWAMRAAGSPTRTPAPHRGVSWAGPEWSAGSVLVVVDGGRTRLDSFEARNCGQGRATLGPTRPPPQRDKRPALAQPGPRKNNPKHTRYIEYHGGVLETKSRVALVQVPYMRGSPKRAAGAPATTSLSSPNAETRKSALQTPLDDPESRSACPLHLGTSFPEPRPAKDQTGPPAG